MDFQDLKLKIATLNVRGLRNGKKRKTLFYQLKQQKIDILCLQETHLMEKDKQFLFKELGQNFHMSEGTKNSKGIITYFNKNIDFQNTKILLKNDRILISYMKIDATEFIIINLVHAVVKLRLPS